VRKNGKTHFLSIPSGSPQAWSIFFLPMPANLSVVNDGRTKRAHNTASWTGPIEINHAVENFWHKRTAVPYDRFAVAVGSSSHIAWSCEDFFSFILPLLDALIWCLLRVCQAQFMVSRPTCLEVMDAQPHFLFEHHCIYKPESVPRATDGWPDAA